MSVVKENKVEMMLLRKIIPNAIEREKKEEVYERLMFIITLHNMSDVSMIYGFVLANYFFCY